MTDLHNSWFVLLILDSLFWWIWIWRLQQEFSIEPPSDTPSACHQSCAEPAPLYSFWNRRAIPWAYCRNRKTPAFQPLSLNFNQHYLSNLTDQVLAFSVQLLSQGLKTFSIFLANLEPMLMPESRSLTRLWGLLISSWGPGLSCYLTWNEKAILTIKSTNESTRKH